MLDHARLLELLDYDSGTGVFTWRVTRGRCAKAGARAGGVHRNGYGVIRIDQRNYATHRVAWFYVHGVWPEGDLDHRDRDRLNNRISNLRAASRSSNMGNTAAHRDGATGKKGVWLDRRRGTFTAMITKNGRRLWLGSYATADEAGRAYAAAAVDIFGAFAFTGDANA